MIGKCIKQMRKDKNLSQEEIGKIVGFARNTISQYENEVLQPDFETIEKIAKICGFKIYFDNGKEKFQAKDLERKDI